MRKLILGVALLVVAVIAALWFREHNDPVFIKWAEWRIRTSPFVVVAALVVVWFALTATMGLIRRVWRAPTGMRQWVWARRHKRARQGLINALVAMAEGQYASAERTLVASSEAFDLPVLSHLLAALAAQRRGAWEARDEYLRRAHEAEPKVQAAVGLLQARMQADAEQWEQALATLNDLRQRIPANRSALALLSRTLEVLGDWQELGKLLPELRRREALPPETLDDLEVRVFEARLSAVEDAEALDDVWGRLSRDQRRRPALQAAYARGLVRAGRHDEAYNKLKGWLRRSLDGQLLRVWGRLSGSTARTALRQTEKWLEGKPEHAELLCAAGRLAAASDSLERSRYYLEAASARMTDPQLEADLAEVLERMGESDEARQAYRRALGRQASRAALPAETAGGEDDHATGAAAE